MNKVILIGRLTRDPEVRVLSTGTAVAKFSLAINRNFRNKEGNIDADFINITVYGRQVDVVQKYTSKGSQIGVEGRIQTRTYDAQDGTKRYTTDVVVDNFEFLGSRNDGGNTNNYRNPSSNNSVAYSPEAPQMPGSVETTDISEDPYKDFGDEFTLSSDDLPF